MDEKTFLKQYDSSKYEKPSVTADLVIFSVRGSVREAWENPQKAELKALLIQRGRHPFQGFLALPGGFANSKESLEEAAARELKEETGVEAPYLEPVGTYSRPGRDPRGWVITTAFRSFLPEGSVEPKAADDARKAGWFLAKLSLEKEDKRETSAETRVEKLWKLTLIKEEEQTEILTRERFFIGEGGRSRELTLLDNGKMAFDHGLILTEAMLKKTGYFPA